jgi:hypothetical protein
MLVESFEKNKNWINRFLKLNKWNSLIKENTLRLNCNLDFSFE